MAASPSMLLLLSLISSSSNTLLPPFLIGFYSPGSRIHPTMMLSVVFFTLSLLSISIIVISLYSRRCRKHHHHVHGLEKQETQKAITSVNTDGTTFLSEPYVHEEDRVRDEEEEEEEEKKKKKKKKRGKKKRPDPDGGSVEERKKERKEEFVCLYPFTTSTSATQRKIKHQYDQLVKSHESNGLTLAQVGQFVNCLVESKKELQHRSEVIQRKFTIAKALLLKADRSSFDRLRQQIYKLELEQKRLEEDAFVYNWLQQQLKVSPAYKKMLEICACMEMKAKSCEQVESTENEIDDISFEELLAQEKKDAFWQRNGKSKSCSV